MSFKQKGRFAYQPSNNDDSAMGFRPHYSAFRQEQDTVTRSEFDYDLDVDMFKLHAARLNYASKQLSKIQPEIIKKQTRQNSSQIYTSKRLGRYQETYQSEIREAEDAIIAITNLLHLDAPETGKLQRDSGDRSWEVTMWREKHKKAEEDRDTNMTLYVSLKYQVERLQQHQDELKGENAKLRKELSEREKDIKGLLSENANLLRNYKQEKAEKDDELTRSSAVASSKVRDNSPNIADLSDVNRPTKIAEKMSELYDNEWTDAFDSLEKSHPDTDVAKVLLDILKTISTQCYEMAWQDFFPHVQNAIEIPARILQKSKAPASFEDNMILPKEMQQQIKAFRKVRAPIVLPIIQNELLPKDVDSYELRAYYNRCVEVCWLAAVQDPPLFMNFNAGEKFDTTLFKDYTARGPYVEFLVSPALHLHDKGPLLSKGVAQGSLSQPQGFKPHMKDETRSLRAK